MCRHCQRQLIPKSFGVGKRWAQGGGERLPEFAHFLNSECMIRRRKEDVLTQLPPFQRQVVQLARPDAAAYTLAHKLAWEVRTLASQPLCATLHCWRASHMAQRRACHPGAGALLGEQAEAWCTEDGRGGPAC